MGRADMCKRLYNALAYGLCVVAVCCALLLGLATGALAQAPAKPGAPAPLPHIKVQGAATFATPIYTPEEMKPTTIPFDFYVADEYRGMALVTYTPTWGELNEGSEVSLMLKNIKKGTDFSPLFNGKVNGLTRKVAGLGEVVIDPSIFRVTVTLSPQVLKVIPKNVDIRSLHPESVVSLRQAFQLNTISDLSGSTDLTFYHDTEPSFGRTRLDWAGYYTTPENKYHVSNLYSAWQSLDSTFKIGMLQTPGQSFATSTEFAGFELGSNQDTLFDDKTTNLSSNLQIFVPSRARVNIYRNSQLIYTRILGFGLQEVDTGSFPQGSYNVRIQIQPENGGPITQQVQFFSKTGRLVPFGKTDWQLDAGYARDNTTVGGSWLAQGSVRWRLNKSLDAGIGAYTGEGGLAIFEPSFHFYWRDLDVQNDLTFSNKGDLANSLTANLYDMWGNWSLRMAKTFVSNTTPPDVTTGFSPNAAFDPFVGKTQTLAFGYTNYFGRLTTRFNALKVSNTLTDTWSYGPELDYALLRAGPHHLDLNLSRNWTNQGVNSSYLLQYQYLPIPTATDRHKPSYTVQAGATDDAQNSHQLVANTSIQYTNRDSTNHPGLDLATNTHTVYGGADNNNANTTADISAQLVGRHAQANITASKGIGPDRAAQRSIGVEASTAMIYTPNSGLEVSAPPSGQAFYMLELKGNAAGTPMVVYNNGQHLADINVGERIAIPLIPFRSYSITILPRDSDALVSYNNTPDVFTVNPGNIHRRTYDIEKVLLLFGRLVDASGKPLPWTRIRGASTSALTDQFGNFQAEFTRSNVLYVQNKETSCTVALPQQKQGATYAYLGDILCL